jgi:hypothetical protein
MDWSAFIGSAKTSSSGKIKFWWHIRLDALDRSLDAWSLRHAMRAMFSTEYADCVFSLKIIFPFLFMK